MTPLQFTFTVLSQSSHRTFFISSKYITPALFTKISMGPNVSSAIVTQCNIASLSVTSVGIHTMSTVPFLHASAIIFFVTSSCLILRAAIAMLQPERANSIAIPRPIPDDAPVTMATFPFRSGIRSNIFRCSGDFVLVPTRVGSMNILCILSLFKNSFKEAEINTRALLPTGLHPNTANMMTRKIFTAPLGSKLLNRAVSVLRDFCLLYHVPPRIPFH